MNALIACEESQAVCIEFRKRGHEAFSCDILSCSGGHPEWHIMADIINVIKGGWLFTESGETVFIDKWDIMIGFPPCTYITVTGARWMYNKDGSINKEREQNQKDGIAFFMSLMESPIDKIALENPIGVLSSLYRKPDQIIQPYYFGDEAQKTTCLWLKNLPPLYHNDKPNLFDSNVTHVYKGDDVMTSTGKTFSKWYWETSRGSGKERAMRRSKTFPGIAKAMAEQWG